MADSGGFDVIVIGGGLAGLIAANRAAELGRRAVVLEKGSEEQYLCNSRYTYGTFHIHFTGVDADETRFSTRSRPRRKGPRARTSRVPLPRTAAG